MIAISFSKKKKKSKFLNVKYFPGVNVEKMKIDLCLEFGWKKTVLKSSFSTSDTK